MHPDAGLVCELRLVRHGRKRSRAAVARPVYGDKRDIVGLAWDRGCVGSVRVELVAAIASAVESNDQRRLFRRLRQPLGN